MRLVGMARRVKALVVFVPTQTEAARLQAITALVGVGLLRAVEIADEVFFAGEVGAPGRLAAGAIGQRAYRAQALRVGGGAQKRVARGRTRKIHGRARGDPTRAGRGPHHHPARAAAHDLDHRHAHRRLRLAHLLSVPGALAVGV